MSDPRNAARAVVARLSGIDVEHIDVELVDDALGADAFEVTSSGGRLRVRATGPGAAAAGWALFARRTGVGAVSRSGIRRAEAPLADLGPVRGRSRVPHRVAYNITVGGYTTPYFDRDDWDRELDLLAASGITAAHLTLGQEAVWLGAFARFGYPEAELLDWIVPPSHQPWQWLNNIQHQGGVSRALVESRAELARHVLARMADLDITPILPGFSGTVPTRFDERVPGAHIVPQGLWYMDVAGPRRPDWLATDSAVYGEVADAFYAEQRALFGPQTHWAVDLLHEGGKTGGVELADAARGVEAAMRRAEPQYTWVIQSWLGNPRPELLAALDPQHLLVLDLTGENWAAMDSFAGVPWAYGILPNYGGRLGLYGDLAAIAATPDVLSSPDAGQVVGLTDMAEGVANNPVVWDLFHDLAWADETIDLDSWLPEWVAARYGVAHPSALAAWETLRSTVYGAWRSDAQAAVPEETRLAMADTPVDAARVRQGEAPVRASAEEEMDAFTVYVSTDSVFSAVPSVVANQGGLMGRRALPYDPAATAMALRRLLAAAEESDVASSLRYDLVDVARQALADAARVVLPRAASAVDAGDVATFDSTSGDFLALLDACERVLATHTDFLLGSWTRRARAAGTDDAESAALERDAVRLLTSWGRRDSVLLAEYANRDWAGLVGGYYRERWVRWFSEVRAALLGEPTTPVDWYAFAEGWIDSLPPQATEENGDTVEQARAALALLDRVYAA